MAGCVDSIAMTFASAVNSSADPLDIRSAISTFTATRRLGICCSYR
jgi:hypothetical protein